MNSYNRDYHEKRNFIRMRVDTPVSVLVDTDSSDSPIKGTCKDLSGGGMLIELNQALPADSEVTVVIETDHGHAPMFKAKGRVVRVKGQPTSTSQPCELGVEIVEVLN